jgi:predicted acylesterase/phospholipase RssA
LLGACLILGLAACAQPQAPRTPPPGELYQHAAPPGIEPARVWGDRSLDARLRVSEDLLRRGLEQEWEAAGRPADGVSYDILALSGGGPDGAFSAGLLAGWTEAGDRPEFDLVTGVSIGALVAPFAFLGSDWDAEMERLFTETETGDVVEFQFLAALAGANSVGDTQPLREMLEEIVDDAFLRAIVAADRPGRGLLIGTTHIDSGRPMIWDLTVIARAGDAALFRQVLLASAAIPGAFPPEPIEVEANGRRFVEYHVDGNVTHGVIVWPDGFDRLLARRYPFPVRKTVYVIENNPLRPTYRPVEDGVLSIASRSLSTLIRSQTAADLAVIHAETAAAGAAFRLAFVPPGFDAEAAAVFDSAYMRRLFDAARADARDGVDWLEEPPAGLVDDAPQAAAP